jgi:hypothetical protein
MCQLCALASRYQKFSKSDPQILNRPLSVLVTLNPKTPKPGKLSASNNQSLPSDSDARPDTPL